MNNPNHSIHVRPAVWMCSLVVFGFLFCQAHAANAQVTGSGTINRIPKWSPTPAALADSVIFDNGFVGIGTINPGSKLEVAGDVRGKASGPAFFLYDTSGAVDARQFYFRNIGGTIYGRWVNDANSLVVAETITFKNSGDVGIGTASPGYPLDVVAHAGTNIAARFRGNHAANNNTQIRFFGANAAAELWAVGNAVATGDATRNFDIFDLVAGTNRLRIDSSGNLGIGTTSPTKKLDVAGDIHASGGIDTSGTISGGNVVAKYQDVAEWVPARHVIPAGTVVVLDAERSNHVLASTRAYDTRVAGVISANPGVLLGEGGEGKVMVATTGRVRVKVDATNAPIRVGDLLVTSDKEGIAMRSQPLDLGGTPIHRPGTLIGKALEPLEKGVGEILVLLSLQ